MVAPVKQTPTKTVKQRCSLTTSVQACLRDQISLALNHEQYHNLTFLYQWVSLHQYRPTMSPIADPRGWWEYAYQLATRKPLPRLRKRLSPASIVKLGARRRRYVALYKRVWPADWQEPLHDDVSMASTANHVL